MLLLIRRCIFVLLILVSVIYAARPDRYVSSSRTSMESTTILPILSSSSTSGTMVYDAIHSSKTTSEAYLNHSSWSSEATTSPSDVNSGKAARKLTANGGIVTESQGNVIITGNAANVELMVTSGLTIGVNLDNCHSKILICYEAEVGTSPPSWAQSACQSASQCATSFEEDRSRPQIIWFNENESKNERSRLPGYTEASMTSEMIRFFSGTFIMDGCAPKIENGLVRLPRIIASSGCPVTIRHAKIKPAPASNAPTDANGNLIKATTQGAADSSLTTWQIVGISIAVFIAVVVICVVIYCIVKDLKKKQQPVKAPPPKSSINHAHEDYASMVAEIPEFAKLKAKAAKNKANKKTKSKRAKKSAKATKKAAEVEPAAAPVGCLPPPVLEPAIEMCKEPAVEPLPEAKPVAPPVIDAPKEEPLLVDATQEDETKKVSKKKKKAKKPKTAPPPARVDNTSFEAPPQPTTERELSVDVTQEHAEPASKAERGRAAVPAFCNVVKEKPEEWYSSLRRGDIPHPRSNLSRSGRSEKKSKPRQQ